MTATVTLSDLARHTAPEEAWVALHGLVYNVTPFLAAHPGGRTILLRHAGSDASVAFERIGHSSAASDAMAPLCIGALVDKPLTAEAAVELEKGGAAAPPANNKATDSNSELSTASDPGDDLAAFAPSAPTRVDDRNTTHTMPILTADDIKGIDDPSSLETTKAAKATATPAETSHHRHRPAQTRRVPLLGNTLNMNLTNPHQTFLAMARAHGGSLFRVDFGLFRNPMNIVVDPAAGAAILRREGTDFAKGPGYGAIRSVTPFHLLVADESLAAPRRRLVEQCVALAVDHGAPLIAEVLSSWDLPLGQPTEMSSLLRLLALDMMARLLFGRVLTSGDAVSRCFVKDLHTVMAEWHYRITDVLGLWRIMRTPRVRKAERALARLLAFLDAEIEAAVDGATVEANLRGAEAEAGETAAAESATDAEAVHTSPSPVVEAHVTSTTLLQHMVQLGAAKDVMRDTCFTLLAMGHENISTCMSWAVYLLSTASDVQAKARAEVQAAAITTTVRADLPYITAVLKETMRLYPSIPMLSRQNVAQDVTHVDNYAIPATVSKRYMTKPV